MAARASSSRYLVSVPIKPVDDQPHSPYIRPFITKHIQDLENNRIETLNLCGVELRQSEFTALFQVLSINTSLCELNLQHNYIHTERAIELIDAIRNHPNLAKVDLRHNLIGISHPDSRKLMKSALVGNKSLKILYFSQNPWERSYYPKWAEIQEILRRSIPKAEIDGAYQELKEKVAIKIKSSIPKQDPSVEDLMAGLKKLSNERKLKDGDNDLLFRELAKVYHTERFLQLIRKRLPETPKSLGSGM